MSGPKPKPAQPADRELLERIVRAASYTGRFTTEQLEQAHSAIEELTRRRNIEREQAGLRAHKMITERYQAHRRPAPKAAS